MFFVAHNNTLACFHFHRFTASLSLVAFVTALPLYSKVALTALLCLSGAAAAEAAPAAPAFLGQLSSLFSSSAFAAAASAAASVSYTDAPPQSFTALTRKAIAVCAAKGLRSPAAAEVRAVARRLAAAGLVQIERGYALERGFLSISPRYEGF